MAAASQPAAPFVAMLVGQPGLALEVFGQLLVSMAVVVVESADASDDITTKPDVVVLVEPGPEHWASVEGKDIPMVLVQGEEADDAGVVHWVLAGADAVLHCDTDPETVLGVLTEVSRGGSVLQPVQMRAVAGLARAAGAQPGVVLSRRERQILASIAEGNAVKQTARALEISPKTVENLQGRLFRKLGARNRAQAVARAHGLGLL